MPGTRHVMAKVVLVGDNAVGKTSLIRRYVVDRFGDEYLVTLGAKVSKKVVELDSPRGGARVSLNMNVWDIMGQASFRDFAKEAYFHGARGIFAVVDLTQRATLDGIGAWIRAVREVAGPVPSVLSANKTDLEEQAAFSPADVASVAQGLGCPSFLTSAKTGENVEAAFQELARRVVGASESA